MTNDYPIKHVSTNLITDEEMCIGHKLVLKIDEYRNGNLNLVCENCNKTICECQNNDLTDLFEEQMLDEGFEPMAINEFMDDHLQNMKTLEENIKDFKEWIK